MRYYLSIIFLTSYFLFGCRQEVRQTIEFSSEFISTSKEKILLRLVNESSDTIFYFIGVVGISEKGTVVPIASDIKSLGQEGSLVLMPLISKGIFMKEVSKRDVLKLSIDQSIKKIRFFVTYFKVRDFTSENKTLWGEIL